MRVPTQARPAAAAVPAPAIGPGTAAFFSAAAASSPPPAPYATGAPTPPVETVADTFWRPVP